MLLNNSSGKEQMAKTKALGSGKSPTVLKDRLAELDSITLEHGSHSPDHTFCVMEAVAYIAGEPWSDAPECVSPVITAFMVNWNDSLNDEDRQMLKPLIPKVIGTRTSKKDEETRAWMATDWLARECAPAWLRLAGLTAQAEALENLAPLTSAASARKAQPRLVEAKAAARAAAWAAAGDAAGAAAWDALQPTVKGLQASAIFLVERMCEVGRV